MQPETNNSTPRLLPWEASLNTRELGGYPTTGGRMRWKALVRSENSAALTPAGRQAAIDYGIRTVIDLRFPDELRMSQSAFTRPTQDPPEIQPDYINIPLDTDQDLAWPSTLSPAEIVSDLYCRLLETNRGHVSGALTSIARARPGGVMFHCHAGKDRTGLIAAMLLGFLGAPEAVILEDYAFTTPALDRRREALLADPSLTPDRRNYLEVLSLPRPETMQLTLAYLARLYGGVEGYLRTTPLLGEDLERLRERLVEPLE
jgi:protein-tyrosine phosphatase